jgi:hypothetical protein
MANPTVQNSIPVSTITYSYQHVPTIRDFTLDNTKIKAIMGPFGSGKSSGAVMELVRRCWEQAPGKDGVRRTRWAVVRNSYPQLIDTTIQTFRYWLDRFGEYKATSHDFFLNKMAAPDGSPIEALFMFRALDQPRHVDNLLSLEVTGAWFNEVREIPKVIWDTMQGRIGRYPPMQEGGCTWDGMIGDTNPPDTDHWFYTLFEEERPMKCAKCITPNGGPILYPTRRGMGNEIIPIPERRCPVCRADATGAIPLTAIYKQPSGRSPTAENLPNLKPGYYDELMIGKDFGWIAVYVDGKYGYVRDGKPVYGNWSDEFHLSANDLEPHRSYPIIVGLDFASHPAAVICQLHPNGRLSIFDEFYAEEMGPKRFLRTVVYPYMWAKYTGLQWILSGDPSGVNTQYDSDERNAFMSVREVFGNERQINIPETNAWGARYDAVDQYLVSPVMQDGKGKLLLNPRCKMLHKGFLGEYRMKRLQVSGREYYQDRPEKNKASHIHDALQYAAMASTKNSRFYRPRSVRVNGPAPNLLGWT